MTKNLFEMPHLPTEHKSVSHREVLDLTKAARARQVAEQMGIGVSVVAEQGQKYTSTQGATGTVPTGKQAVEIVRPADKDMTEFWKRVNAAE